MMKHKTAGGVSAGRELLLAALIGMAGAWSLLFLYFWMLFINQIHYLVENSPIPAEISAVTLALGALILPGAAWFSRDFFPKLRLLNRALFPLLVPVPALLLWPESYFCLLLPVLAGGIAFYRLGAAFPPENYRRWHRLPPRCGVVLAGLGFAAAVWWYFGIQCRAYDRFFLFFSDWGEYSENYLRLAFGENRSWTDFLAVAGHWNPVPNVVMTLLFRLHPAAVTVFAVNALLLGSAVSLTYALARSARLPVAAALAFGAAAFLNPVLNGQALSLFYGYHPINFLVPVLLGFFVCRARKNRMGMAVLFLLSFLVQETAAVFWAGYALYWLAERRRLAGTALFLGCAAFFLVISSVVMPNLFAHASYAQMFHYSALGSTPLEVLCSPFLRPAAFWRTVFEWQNFAFVCSLLLPLALPVLMNPKLAVAALPLLAGVCLQSSPDVKNIVMQYGVESSVLLLAVAVLNAARLNRGRGSALLGFIGRGIPRNRHASIQLWGLCFGTLALTAGSYFLIGRYAVTKMNWRPDVGSVIEELRREVPRESRVIATSRQRVHFLFRNPTAGLDAKPQTGDTVILALDDDATGAGELERFRAELAANPAAVPLGSIPCGGDQLVVFRLVPPGTPSGGLPFLVPMSAGQFAGSGPLLEQENPDFEVRAGSRGGTVPLLMVRPLRPVDYDVNIEIGPGGGKAGRVRLVPFANGLVPAYAAQAGQVFIAPLPEAAAGPVAVRILRRPESGPLASRKK